jgi:putative hydrolase
MAPVSENPIIAERLREIAALLEQQRANPYRIAAYRKAADTVDSMPQQLSVLFRTRGLDGLAALPAVGPQIARAIAQMLRTGRWPQLDRLRGELDPEALFSTVPGIGPRLAHLVMETLHVDSLEGLEMAAHDGRLARVPRFGPRRLAMVRAELAQMLGRVRSQEKSRGPNIDVLLDVDREYREKVENNSLRRIAPRRFNPKHEAWLPILHTERAGWHFTVLYSNTGLAHRLGRTTDWVIIFFSHDHYEEGQCTVVTESRGPLAGQRVVRGREQECEAHYSQPVPLPLHVA